MTTGCDVSIAAEIENILKLFKQPKIH